MRASSFQKSGNWKAEEKESGELISNRNLINLETKNSK
jgi:hypothetical protein